MIFIQYKSKLPTRDELELELVKEAICKNETLKEASIEIGVSERWIYRKLSDSGTSSTEVRKEFKLLQKKYGHKKRTTSKRSDPGNKGKKLSR